MLCAIRYLLYNLKNAKNTFGGVLVSVKLLSATLLKVLLLRGCFSRFFNCTYGAKSGNAPQIISDGRAVR